jgi:hypothetical protein
MLNEKALALSAGILWGGTVFITTLLASTTGYGMRMMEVYGNMHPGYAINVAGAFVGLVYGFACAAIGAYVLAWLYNMFEKKYK